VRPVEDGGAEEVEQCATYRVNNSESWQHGSVRS
jgi:hypothetical protein